MTGIALSATLGAAILVVLAWRTRRIMRAERGQRRGSPPGRGHHVLRSEYFSGGGGGGEAREYTVPRDPQDYARFHVPRNKRKAKTDER